MPLLHPWAAQGFEVSLQTEGASEHLHDTSYWKKDLLKSTHFLPERFVEF